MKKPINSTAGKYIVNVLMIVIFVALAYTGLFDGGRHEGRPGERHEDRPEYSSQSREGFESAETDKAAVFDANQNFKGERNGEPIGDHAIYGIIWSVLMALHIYQHWEWYKKMFSAKHLLKNKLLTATVVAFAVLILSGIVLLFHLVPRGFINIKEIHEISGYLIVALILIHVIQRINWYVKSTRKLFGRKPEPVAVTQL